MPEGDSIFRAARTLHRALAGRSVTAFTSVFPRLTRIDDDAALEGRVIERVESRGKHLLIWFGPNLVLRTHMRMNGSWHIYRPGERWQRPRHDMRIVIETAEIHAVAFNVPVAEFETAASLAREIHDLGPDPLSSDFDAAAAVERIAARGDVEIADALLDQTAIAGIGNIYKSELLFMAGVHPFRAAKDVGRGEIARIVALAEKFMRTNAIGSDAGMTTYHSMRRTTGRAEPGGRFWVYGRAGKPCRRCGTPVSRGKQGPHVRSTYWCERCQPAGSGGSGVQ